MPNPARSRSVLALVLAFAFQQQDRPRPETALARDLGLEVLDVAPLAAPLPRPALARVAEHVGRPVGELEGARLYTGAIRRAGAAREACEFAVLPLSGVLAGGRVTLAARDGTILSPSIWGALDFDRDPTGRWDAFLLQLQPSRMHRVGRIALDIPSTREVAGRLARLDQAADGVVHDEEARLGRALVAQRLAMRKNAMFGFCQGRPREERVRPGWLAELAADMERLAKSSKDLTQLLGPEGAQTHAEAASELAGLYRDAQSLLEAEPENDLAEFRQPVGATCSACHDATTGGTAWRELCSRRREELGLGATAMVVGYDVTPALGDDGRASAELADKIRAGLLLLAAARE